MKNRYLGEAYFVRAYAYFYIMRVWGDPVYVSATYDDVDYGQIPPIARTSETTVIDSSLADLELAAGFLSYASSNTQVTRASKGQFTRWLHTFLPGKKTTTKPISIAKR